MIEFRELKARKAKFGFDFGNITLSKVVKLGKFIEALENTWPDKYLAEEAGYNRPELKIYTDDETVATWIRTEANNT
jgi:hypothetical protein